VDIIKNKITEWLNKYHQVGENTGGSGHLSLKTLVIEKIEIQEKADNLTASIICTIIIETEFTLDPDNPPYYNKYQYELKLDNNGENISLIQEKFIESNFEPINFDFEE
jgi:hypothetical protein